MMQVGKVFNVHEVVPCHRKRFLSDGFFLRMPFREDDRPVLLIGSPVVRYYGKGPTWYTYPGMGDLSCEFRQQCRSTLLLNMTETEFTCSNCPGTTYKWCPQECCAFSKRFVSCRPSPLLWRHG